MTDYQANFIQKMRFFRKKAGITQAQLAEICGVANGTIGNIECGFTKPSFDLIIKIAGAVKIPPAEFFKTDEDSKISDDSSNFSQFETVRDNLNSAMAEVFSKAMQDLQNVKFKIEH